MYHPRVKTKGLLIALFCVFGLVANAQTGSTSNPLNQRENNPYSKYGIGELWNANTAELQGMGSITSAYADGNTLNADNPASYAFLQRTVIEGGAIASTRTVDGSGLSYKTGTLSIAYLNIGVPVGKNGGLSFGLRPYSRSYFSLVDTAINTSIGSIERSYGGQGSLNYAYIGGAAKYKGLSVGFNFGYLFGTFQQTTALVPIDTNAINRAYISNFTNYVRIGGIYWKGGAMYETRFHDSTYALRLGATVTLSQNLTERLNAYQISVYNFGDTIVNDTSYNPGEQRGKLKMPMSYCLGAMLAKSDLWSVGIDYSATQWNTFNSSPESSMNIAVGNQSNRLSIGGEINPLPVKAHKHYSRLSYRLGMYYGTDYLQINGTALPVYGVTFGGSLHFKPTHFSWVNLHTAFDIGRIGTTQNNLIQQTYVRWLLGISFNDRWFIPRKYD